MIHFTVASLNSFVLRHNGKKRGLVTVDQTIGT